jgi:hypothetical protein
MSCIVPEDSRVSGSAGRTGFNVCVAPTLCAVSLLVGVNQTGSGDGRNNVVDNQTEENTSGVRYYIYEYQLR